MVKEKKVKKNKRKIFSRILTVFIVLVAVIAVATAAVNIVVIVSEHNFISNSVRKAQISEQLVPELDGDGYYTFTTDRAFKILQITDVHIGAGYMSAKKDISALNAVSAMISEEKPDLVIITGDTSYPIPFHSGTFNNKTSADIFASLMEQLGVYWCNVYGNHDTEAYSYFNRANLSKLVYGNRKKYPHCLFQAGPNDVDGYGNYIIKIKNTKGETVQALYMIDSHSYIDGDVFGLLWKYDAIHKNQVEWYKKTVGELTEENGGKTPNSLAFFHIAPQEMTLAFEEYKNAGFTDTENVKYKFGKNGESDSALSSSKYNYGIFDAFKGGSTKGVFFGHDHLDNISLVYKDVQLTYGYSIDYLAYKGIYKYGVQRGCTVIDVMPDGSFDTYHENYYQDKYKTIKPKEDTVLDRDMREDYDNAGALFSFQTNNKDKD